MAARRARAAEAGPGATSGRREGVPGKGDKAKPSLFRESSPDPELTKGPFEEKTARGQAYAASGGHVSHGRTYALGGDQSTSAEEVSDVESRKSADAGNYGITVSDPYAILYSLEHPGSFEIILLAFREGPTNPSRMRQRLRPGPKALNRAVRALERAGLISVLRSKSFPFTQVVELTVRGKELAETMRSWPQLLVE